MAGRNKGPRVRPDQQPGTTRAETREAWAGRRSCGLRGYDAVVLDENKPVKILFDNRELRGSAQERRDQRLRGQMNITWIGQGGYLVEQNGWRLAIDPYLTDALAASHGLHRLAPPPVAIADLGAQAVFVTHDHLDHFDPETLGPWMQLSLACRLIGPQSVVDHGRRLGIEESRLELADRRAACRCLACADAHTRSTQRPGGRRALDRGARRWSISAATRSTTTPWPRASWRSSPADAWTRPWCASMGDWAI